MMKIQVLWFKSLSFIRRSRFTNRLFFRLCDRRESASRLVLSCRRLQNGFTPLQPKRSVISIRVLDRRTTH